jgi:hypothetical protein
MTHDLRFSLFLEWKGYDCPMLLPRLAFRPALRKSPPLLLVAEGKFRQDLLYRLNVVPIEMPSLRERVADIPLLVEYFIDRFGKNKWKEVQNNR